MAHFPKVGGWFPQNRQRKWQIFTKVGGWLSRRAKRCTFWISACVVLALQALASERVSLWTSANFWHYNVHCLSAGICFSSNFILATELSIHTMSSINAVSDIILTSWQDSHLTQTHTDVLRRAETLHGQPLPKIVTKVNNSKNTDGLSHLLLPLLVEAVVAPWEMVRDAMGVVQFGACSSPAVWGALLHRHVWGCTKWARNDAEHASTCRSRMWASGKLSPQ